MSNSQEIVKLFLNLISLWYDNEKPVNNIVLHSASLRGERGAEPMPLPVAPLRENQGHETDRFAAAQPRVMPNKMRSSL